MSSQFLSCNQTSVHHLPCWHDVHAYTGKVRNLLSARTVKMHHCMIIIRKNSLHTAPDHGSCTVPNECICDEGYTGEFCNMDIDVCGHQQPCAVGSTCANTGPDQYLCSCAAGFTGQNCDTEINECLSDPCLNGATCFVSHVIIFKLLLSVEYHTHVHCSFSYPFLLSSRCVLVGSAHLCLT